MRCDCPDFEPDSEYHLAQHLADEHAEPGLLTAMDERAEEDDDQAEQ